MDSEPKEHSDLLSPDQKDSERVENNGTLIDDEVGIGALRVPPDGGIWAYTVMVGSFLTNGLLFGVINSYSVIYKELQKKLEDEGVHNSEIRASLVGVLAMGTTFLLSPLSGVLTSYLGLRLTAVLGGSIAAAGLLFSSFFVHQVDALCFTYGIMYGLGASLAYTPSLAILGHYYKKYLGIVNGIVTIGSSVFTVFMPVLMDHMIKNHGLSWMFRLLSLFTFGVALCGLLFKPIPLLVIETPNEKKSNIKAVLKTIANVKLWRNKRYRLWALSMPVALFGYYVPYVHIGKFIEVLNLNDVDNIPLQCIAVTSGIGRITFGFLGDMPRIDRILLQQISFYVIGVLTILLPFVKSFTLLVLISLGMGLFEGGFIALIGPIAFELCGSGLAAQAIGCMLGMAALPLSAGPPVAGALFSHYKSYTVPFVLAGVSPLVGATLMFMIRLQRPGRHDSSAQTVQNGHISLSQAEVEKDPIPLLAANGDVNPKTAA